MKQKLENPKIDDMISVITKHLKTFITEDPKNPHKLSKVII